MNQEPTMHRLRTVVLTFILFAASAPAAVAGTITFEGSVGTADGIGAFLDVDGYRFMITGGNANAIGFITDQNTFVEPATTKLLAANHTQVTMTKVGGGTFNLLSADIGGGWIDFPVRWASSVYVTEGGTIISVALPPVD